MISFLTARFLLEFVYQFQAYDCLDTQKGFRSEAVPFKLTIIEFPKLLLFIKLTFRRQLDPGVMDSRPNRFCLNCSEWLSRVKVTPRVHACSRRSFDTTDFSEARYFAKPFIETCLENHHLQSSYTCLAQKPNLTAVRLRVLTNREFVPFLLTLPYTMCTTHRPHRRLYRKNLYWSLRITWL